MPDFGNAPHMAANYLDAVATISWRLDEVALVDTVASKQSAELDDDTVPAALPLTPFNAQDVVPATTVDVTEALASMAPVSEACHQHVPPTTAESLDQLLAFCHQEEVRGFFFDGGGRGLFFAC